MNLIANGDFSAVNGAEPAGWHAARYSGKAEFAMDAGRTRALQSASPRSTGADAGWMTTFKVEPHTMYRLSGWIKTARS